LLLLISSHLVTPLSSVKFNIKEYSKEEKELFLNELDKMTLDTPKACYDAIIGGVLKQILCCL
jgi:hypothetical protein